MKQVIAIVKPHVAEKVIEALAEIPLAGPCTASEVKGFGRQKSYLGEYRGSEYSAAYLPKVCISFCVYGEYLYRATSVIVEAARSGRMGDGKIFVYPCSAWPAPELTDIDD